MTKSLRRITVGALFALAMVPGAASAAVSGTISQSTVASGCEPKGLVAFGAPKSAGAGLPAGEYQYTVVAVTAAGNSTPCFTQTVTLGGPLDSTFIQWNATPGAAAYKIYRNNQALIFAAGPPLVKAVPAVAVCPAAAPNNGARCRFQDNGGPSDPTDPAPAGPAALTQGGSHPDLRIVQTIDYSGDANGANDPYQGDAADTTDVAALKDNVIKFPAGLLANPTATTTACKLSGPAPSLLGDISKHGSSDPDEDTCQRSSQVGTVSVVARVGPDPGRATIVPGDIYIGEKLSAADDAVARLYVVLRPACSAGSFIAPSSPTCVASGVPAGTEVEKSFLSARATLRAGDYGINNETTSIADGTDQDLASTSNVRVSASGQKVGESRLQVRSLTQTLFGFADQGTESKDDDKPFIYMPTNCDPKTISADFATYQDAPNTATASGPLQATGCDALDFSPTLSARVVAPNQTSQNSRPGFIANIFQGAEEAATKNASVTLPAGLGTAVTELARACTLAEQAAPAGCPASSQVGTASATTPVLPGTLAGPVYLAEVPNALPKLIVALQGAANITFDGAISIAPNGRLVNTFNNLPEVTLSSFELSITGGPGGLLSAQRDLCDGGLGNVDALFTGHNGKSVTLTPAVTGLEYYCIPDEEPPVTKRKKPGLKVKVRPRNDKKSPFKFTAKGRLILPKGVGRGKGCKGQVRLILRRKGSGKPLSTTRKGVKRDCSFKVKTSFKAKDLKKSQRDKGKLRAIVRFQGNAVLKAKKVTKQVSYGRKGKK